ncbi:MAG: FtsX-like permease family protein [Nonlabens sp.]
MFKNQLKIAWRSFKNNLFFSSLNILNITVGLLVCILAGSYIYHETSYDQFHTDSKNIYRIGRTIRTQDYAVVGFPNWNNETGEDQKKQAKGLRETAGVELYTQFMIENPPQFLKYDNKDFSVEEVLTTNTAADFTEMFSWDLVLGSFETFAEQENSIILTRSLAERIHGTSNLNQLIGKTTVIDDQNIQVAAIIEDVPATSHFNFTAAVHRDRINYWGAHLYVKKADAVDPATLESNLSERFFHVNPDLATNDTFKGHFIQPILDIHLKSDILYELKEPGNNDYLALLGGFAIIVLLITIFNYTNLTLALKAKASKSIGVNQVLGASTPQMLTQFVIEGVLKAFIALPLLIILLQLSLPVFNKFMGVEIKNYLIESPWYIAGVLVGAVLYGVLLSIIPAVITLNKSTRNLLNTSILSKNYEKISLRKYLMISQIAILIGVSSVSIFMYQQMDFINNKDLGFKKDGVLFTYTDPESIEVFQTELAKSSNISHVGNGSAFAIDNFNNINYKLQGVEDKFSDSNTFYLDFEGVQAYELKTTLTQQQLNPETRSRKNLINRSAAERFAKILDISTEEVIGTTIITEPDFANEDGTMGIPMVVDGIFEDINAFSLKNKVATYFLIVSDQVRFGGGSIVSFPPESTAQVMQDIRDIYKSMGSTVPLDTKLLSDNYAELHKQEKRMATLIYILNAFAIILASLGIVGTTVLLLIGRKREIGIRKLLGATVPQILNISIKEYLIFMAVAVVISTPISYYIASQWLDNFAYRVDINPLIYVGIIILITILVVSLVALSTYRSAMDNPVNSLQTE